MADLETTIVGAGPYGNSIAAHFLEARIPFQMFGKPMESWARYMPEGMLLKSERFASNLWDPHRRFTLERYCAEKRLPYQPVGDPVSLATFLEYSQWFRERTGVESRDVRIVHVRRNGSGFVVKLADGTVFTSRHVILATGHMPFRRIPAGLCQLPEPLFLHTSSIRCLKTFSGRDVTIIGAGQSALETAALLHEAGAHVRLLVKEGRIGWNSQSKPRSFFERIQAPDAAVAIGWRHWAIAELPQVFRWLFPPDKRHGFVADSYGPSGSWWLRDRVDGRIEALLNCVVETATAENGQVRVVARGSQGPQEFLTDHLVAGTGFAVDIDRLGYLDPELRKSIVREGAGIPALSANFETSVPGLFVVGIASAPVFGPVMRFMYGAKHVAPALTRHLK